MKEMTRAAWRYLVPMATVLVAAILLPGCDDEQQDGGGDFPSPSTVQAGALFHPVEIRRPTGPPRIATGTLDEQGKSIDVACSVCHATKPAKPDARIGESLREFHQGTMGAHGNLTCISCHHPGDGFDSLRLADGRKVPYPEVMTLCAQCHGPQFRDYQHGAHGGMTGYWDKSKGGRQRNNCIDCHRPHDPKYPTVRPAPPPIDRQPWGTHDE